MAREHNGRHQLDTHSKNRSKLESDHSKSAGKEVVEARLACEKLWQCAGDVWTRSRRAATVVGAGALEGAWEEAQKQQKECKDSNKLAGHAVEMIKSEVGAAALGSALKLYPPAAVAMGAYGLYSFGQERGPRLFTDARLLKQSFDSAYNCTDERKLNYYKQQLAHRIGRDALQFAGEAVSAGIGLGGGLKGGALIEKRYVGLRDSANAVRSLTSKELKFNPASIEQIKKLYFDQALSKKPFGSRVEVDELGTRRIYHADKSMEAHYTDGSTYRSNPNPKGVGTFSRHNERSREIPGIMRIEDKRNGDRVYKFNDGEKQTHKASGTIIKELPNGVVETHRKNGNTYIEHPNGNVEIRQPLEKNRAANKERRLQPYRDQVM